MDMRLDDWKLLEQPAEIVAPRLLGCEFIRTVNGQKMRVRIVETEAYDQSDPASHSFAGSTQRTAVMFGPAGRVYVYISYGMHFCMNIVTGPAGQGSAVLIRALEPLEGEPIMKANRGGREGVVLTNGPGKVCQALAINKELNDHDLLLDPLQLSIKPPVPAAEIVQTPRIGITKAADVPWRFYLKASPYVSRSKNDAKIA